MRNKVFKNTNKLGVGFDVISVDVQRGRDHGIPPYYKYVEHCFPEHRPINHWRKLEPIIPRAVSNLIFYSNGSVFC